MAGRLRDAHLEDRLLAVVSSLLVEPTGPKSGLMRAEAMSSSTRGCSLGAAVGEAGAAVGATDRQSALATLGRQRRAGATEWRRPLTPGRVPQ